MTKKPTLIPPALTKAQENGQLVLFVGSGLSVPAGAPTWRELLLEITQSWKDNGGPSDVENELNEMIHGSVEEMYLAAEYIRFRAPRAISQHLLERFELLKPQTAHEIIAKIPCAGIITTNFDDLIEKALSGEGRRVDPISPKDTEALAELTRRPGWLLKLHGTYRSGDSAYLTTSDIDSIVIDSMPLNTVLASILQTYTVLFVGFSLRDPDILFQLSRLRSLFKSRSRLHFALMPQENCGRIKAEMLSYLYGIQVLTYIPSSLKHPEVEVFLASLIASKEVDVNEKIAFSVYDLDELQRDNVVVLLHEADTAGYFEGVPFLPTEKYNPRISESELKDEVLRRVMQLKPGIDFSKIEFNYDLNTLELEQFSVAWQTNIRLRLRFVFIGVSSTLRKAIGDQVRFSGRSFEWYNVDDLMRENNCKEKNGIVLQAVAERLRATN